MLPRRRGLDVSTLPKSIREYLAVHPSLIEKRRHYPLIKVLEFMRDDLNLASIDDLLKQDVRSLCVMLQKWVNKKIIESSVKTVSFTLYLVRSFFAFYDIEIPAKKVKVPRKGAKSRVDRIPSIEKLQKLISFSRSARMRMLLFTLPLTGLRLSEALSLRREHIDLERGVLIVPSEHAKIGYAREVPLPSELKNELKHYFEHHFPYERGYIFCSVNNPEKRLPVNRFYELYKDLLQRTGLDHKTPDGSAYALHSHVFRKWYRTMLEAAGVNKLLIDLWLGHNSGVEKHYYLPTPEIIKQEFTKAENVLRIFGHAPAAHDEVTQKLQAAEEAIRFYEVLVKHLTNRNPKLLEELGVYPASSSYGRA